jgi:hypothetical protein
MTIVSLHNSSTELRQHTEIAQEPTTPGLACHAPRKAGGSASNVRNQQLGMNGTKCVVVTRLPITVTMLTCQPSLPTAPVYTRDKRRSNSVRQSIRHKAMGLRRGVGRQPRAVTGIHDDLGVRFAGNEALCVHLCVAWIGHDRAWLKI